LQDDHSWDAVNRIIHRPWFNRVWVIQEYVCATACTIRMGALKMDAAEFFKVALEQNGAAERSGGIIITRARAIRISANLPGPR
jgi:hypothetical protein